MERLDFRLPDFTRVMWVTEKARATWGPRLQRIAAAWEQIERISVVEGLRSAALQSTSPEALPELAQWAARNGLVVLPVALSAAASSYRASFQPAAPGERFEYRVVVTAPQRAADFLTAFQAGNDAAIGEALGYPECCRSFFQEVWVGQHFVDTTWPMAQRTAEVMGDDHHLEVRGDQPEANILLRWIGVRAVPHLPHAFTCEPTAELGRQLLALGEANGFAEEVNWIREMLRWPVEWSALHGIAEIKTPVLKISARTDATGHTYVVRYHGDLYPDEGAQGLVFPFRPPRGRKLTETKAFTKALEETQPTMEGVAQPGSDTGQFRLTPAYYLDNGFATREAQEKAHETVVEMLREACIGLSAPKVLDLGCGNGALLSTARRRLPRLVPYGVEINPDAARNWANVHGDHPGHIWLGDLFDFPFAEEYDVALLMPGRLLEQPEKAKRFVERLQAHTKRLVIYAYGDWLHRYGRLRDLWAATGVAGHLTSACQEDAEAAAGLVVWDEAQGA